MIASLLRWSMGWAAFVPAVIVAVPQLVAADKARPDSPAVSSARQYVTEGLRAEISGDNDARTERLTAALATVPEFDSAEWHLGRIRVADQWLRLDEAEQRQAAEPLLREYQSLRAAAADNLKLLRNLARWCSKAGWHDRARVHYAQVLLRVDCDLDTRQEAIKNLDLHFVGGQWIGGDELKDRQEEAKAADLALRKLRPRVARLQPAIDGDNFDQRQRAIEQLSGFTDPELIPVLESFLNDGGDEFQIEAVRKLATFPQYAATKALVPFAVLAESVLVRDAAAKALQARPLHEFVPLLVGALTAPLESRYEIRKLPNGAVAVSRVLLRETPEQRSVAIADHLITARLIRRQIAPPVGVTGAIVGVIFDNSILFDQERAAGEAERLAQSVKLAADIASDSAHRQNRRIFDTLSTATGQALPDQPLAWWNWWQNYNEYEWPKPTYYTYSYGTSEYYTRPPVQLIQTSRIGRGSCFFAGTPVRTETGIAPIESIQPGDRVLAQDQNSGELKYQVVLRRTLRPAAAMVRISAGGETIMTTLGHPFWVCGHGWKMAKQLAAGDILHTLAGAVRIEAVAPLDGKHAAHNLVVADFNTYFVGQGSFLVHDNEFRRPTCALVPGLIEPDNALARK